MKTSANGANLLWHCAQVPKQNTLFYASMSRKIVETTCFLLFHPDSVRLILIERGFFFALTAPPLSDLLKSEISMGGPYNLLFGPSSKMAVTIKLQMCCSLFSWWRLTSSDLTNLFGDWKRQTDFKVDTLDRIIFCSMILKNSGQSFRQSSSLQRNVLDQVKFN